MLKVIFKTSMGGSLVNLALLNHIRSVINYVVTDKFGITPLIEAVKGCHGQVIKILRAAGARLTAENAGDHFLKAVLGGNLELVKNLLDNGIDPNCSDHNGRTGLHIAASEGLVMLARVLLEHGANIYAKDRFVLFLISNLLCLMFS